MKEMPKYNANLLEHLNPYELKVLMFLLLEPPGEFEMSQREVSEATGISGATVCRVLKSLEEKRAISRYLSRGGRRSGQFYVYTDVRMPPIPRKRARRAA